MFKSRGRQPGFWPEAPDSSTQISSGLPRTHAFSPVLGVVVAVGGLYFLRALFLPLAFAVILMVVLTPIVSFLERILRLPRAIAVAATMLATIFFVSCAGWMLTDQSLQIAEKLPAYRGNIRKKVSTLLNKGRLGQTAAQVQNMSKDIAGAAALPTDPADKSSSPQPRPVSVEIQEPKGGLTGIAEVGAIVLGPIGQVGFVFILTIFMLMNREDLRDRFFRLIGSRRVAVASEAMEDGAKRIGRYFLLQMLTNAGFGASVSVGLYFIGLPNALLWGTLAAFARFIPYVGPLIGASIPAMLAFAIFPDWIQPILVIGLFIALDMVTAYGIEPILFGAHTGISPFALLVSAAFWTVIWGLPGLVLSTPLTVCAVILGQYIPGLSVLHVLLGDQPALSPEAHLYQRLLAMDLSDAKGIAQKYLAESNLLEFYDKLLLPALRLAENDRGRGLVESNRAAGFYSSCSELIGELGEMETTSEGYEVKHNPIPRRIICIPRGFGDSLVCSMFAQLMEARGAGVIVLPLNSTVLDVSSINPHQDDVVLISSFSAPPAQIKTLLQSLRADFPETIRIEARWRIPQETAEGKEKEPERPNRSVVHTLNAAVEAIEKLSPQEISPQESGSAVTQLVEKES